MRGAGLLLWTKSSTRVGRGSSFAAAAQRLVAADDPQFRPALLCLQNRRLPHPGQILEAVSLEQRLVELSALGVPPSPRAAGSRRNLPERGGASSDPGDARARARRGSIAA